MISSSLLLAAVMWTASAQTPVGGVPVGSVPIQGAKERIQDGIDQPFSSWNWLADTFSCIARTLPNDAPGRYCVQLDWNYSSTPGTLLGAELTHMESYATRYLPLSVHWISSTRAIVCGLDEKTGKSVVEEWAFEAAANLPNIKTLTDPQTGLVEHVWSTPQRKGVKVVELAGSLESKGVESVTVLSPSTDRHVVIRERGIGTLYVIDFLVNNPSAALLASATDQNAPIYDPLMSTSGLYDVIGQILPSGGVRLVYADFSQRAQYQDFLGTQVMTITDTNADGSLDSVALVSGAAALEAISIYPDF